MPNKVRRLLKGKTDPSKRHVRLHKWLLDCPAFRSLDPASRALLIELYALFNGSNNGYLFLSVREAARRINVNKDTAARCFKTLRDRGFIRQRAEEPSHWSERDARCWILTEFPFPQRADGDGVGTRDFMKWSPTKNLESRPKRGDTLSDARGQDQGNCEPLAQIVRNGGTERPDFEVIVSETEGHRYYQMERAGAGQSKEPGAERATVNAAPTLQDIKAELGARIDARPSAQLRAFERAKAIGTNR